MELKFDRDRPIFLQIANHLEMEIISAQRAPGSKLPSIRELSALYKVNPNTVQKALSLLEEKGLIHTQRTQGKFVSDAKSQVEQSRKEAARVLTKEYLEKMERLGFSKSDCLSLLEEE